MVVTSKCLKVLHICQRDDTATGGAVRVAVEYIKKLPNYNIDAHCLFLYGSPGHFQSELKERAHYLDIANSYEVFKFGRLLKFICQFKPDIIHHHDGLLWSHLLTFYHPGILKVGHAHWAARTKTSIFARDNLADWVQRLSTNFLICVTENTRNNQIQKGGYLPTQTHVLYNGVDSNRFYPPTQVEKINAKKQFGLPDSVNVVGFVGRLDNVTKGTDDFLRVINLLPSNFFALIVGTGSDAEQLKHLAANLGISERVVFAGNIENTAIAYHALDVFCLTSHWEAFGLVVAEAMACQIPVVGFACLGGVQELLRPDTSYVIPHRDVEKMAMVITKTVEHPESWSERHANAQSLLRQKLDWAKNSSELADWYTTICLN